MKTSKLVTCKTCEEDLAQESTRCPHCGALNFSTVNVVTMVVLVILIFAFVTGGFGGLLTP